MKGRFIIQKVSYDIIRNAVNLTNHQRNVLFGNLNKYIATMDVENGCYVLMETIGKRDECSQTLNQLLGNQLVLY